MKKRNKRFFRKQRPMVQINVVPYIDVMLVLLVIFMITTPILTQGVKVDLPKAQSEKIPSNDSKPIVVTVNKQGEYFINQGVNDPKTALSSGALANAVVSLSQQNPGKPVYVRGDSSASYGEVVKAMALIQKADIDKVGLVTEDGKS
ncbi:protein TolR [Francisella tularensis]|uniref:protein TolR n=1 Tax=Francisella tularensis TaxID=263 RepID=UPI000173E42F|nr:protein TolR [Francisella tularensis]ACD30459.1 group A colicin translocation; tolR protein [Francisella tularensis subsp. mediasiatica FSC147]MBK2077566.1 protein TolR [Francisella tularensis subsp. mediasiatica]MBK2102212.1 protein TolR [Francisella tularensis subsp. mediasiatica]MBK2104750.1 protein TolR [Francisella tularensis subsp. mediasiatica]MDN9002809.1 protein TolR [Francisella tularensis subsp. mediasiatica]